MSTRRELLSGCKSRLGAHHRVSRPRAEHERIGRIAHRLGGVSAGAEESPPMRQPSFLATATPCIAMTSTAPVPSEEAVPADLFVGSDVCRRSPLAAPA